MAMDSTECNGSGEAPNVELEAKAGVEFGSEKDLAKSDGIASTGREVNDQDEIGGPYVIINGDSDNPSEKILKLDEKADPETTSEGKVSLIPSMNASNGIGGKEVEGEVKLDSASGPSQEGLSELGVKLEDMSKGASENGELSENRENNFELRGSAERKEVSEVIVFEEMHQDNGKDRELGDSWENTSLSVEPVTGKSCHETGEECEPSLAGDVEMHQSETVNGENDGSKLVFESGEKEEEEHLVSGSIEGADEENRKKDESETTVEEPNRQGEFDINSAVEEQVPQEVQQKADIAPSVQIMYEESGARSDSHDAQKEAEMLASVLEDPTLNLAVEGESEQQHEIAQEVPKPFEEEEIHEESQGFCDSLQGSKEVEMAETELKELSLLHSTVGVDSELKHEQQVGSGPSQEDEQCEVLEGVYDSMQSKKEYDTLETELNNQSPLDSTVKIDSDLKLEEQQEASVLSQDKEMSEETGVPVPSDDQNDLSEASETDLKEIPSPDFETKFRVVDGTAGGTKIEDQNAVTTVCNGKDNSELEISSPPILFEEEKHALSSTSPGQERLAESETKQKSVLLEANGDSVVAVSDTVSDEDVPAESTKELEEMQHSERSNAACDAQAVSASHKIEVDSGPVIENELVESSIEVVADSENKSSSEVEEGDRSITEFEDGQSKTEAEIISVSSNDASAQEVGLEDSVQIGKFKISIGENGPSILQQELQESSMETEVAMPEEPGTSTSNGEKPEGQQLKRQAIYIIKVPRYSDEEQWEKIQEAQARLDELTRTRDAIRDIMQKKRKACSDSWDEVLKAKEEERAARTVFNAKRHEISIVQSVINKLNKANSIDDMDDLIEMKEKSLQHETMTLKQEKMLIQEIKELKAQRRKLIDNMGSDAEIDEAFDQKDSVFDKLKILKTELEVLGKTLIKAEAKTRAAQKDYDEIDISFCTSQDEYKSADVVRQKSYLYWRDLKSELAKKNKHFFNYRDDQKRAANFLVQNPPDKEGVRLFCSRQAERMMDLWNSDGEFRKQYIKSNQTSTLRRLRTPDGRSLGPDEVPPVIPIAASAYRRTSTPLVPATKEIRLEKSTRASSSTSVQSDDFPELPHHKLNVFHGNNRNIKGTSSKEKSISEPVVVGIVAATTESAHMEKKQEEDEMERRKREEEERASREEDIKRKAKAEAEEKERLREEQKAKAKEAEERKKRKAEKAQERAEFKARREAEIRDKKRSKKDKKKTAGGESDSNDTTNSLSTESSSPSEIAEIKDVPLAAPTATAARRPTRPQTVLKQIKRVEPVPVALRNRSRRKMRSWIIGIVTVIAALLTVFLIGNYVNFSDISSLVWL